MLVVLKRKRKSERERERERRKKGGEGGGGGGGGRIIFIGQDKLFTDVEHKNATTKKDVVIDDYLNISKYILNKVDESKAEENYKKLDEEIKKLIASFTADVIINGKNEEYELSNLVSGSKYKKIYTLSSAPENVSNHVEKNEYKNGSLFITSNGNDPYFMLPNFTNKTASKLLIKIEIKSDIDSFVEIFYANNTEGFAGDKRTQYTIEKGVNTFFAYLEHDKVINKLRFDIGNKPAEYVISCLEVYGQ